MDELKRDSAMEFNESQWNQCVLVVISLGFVCFGFGGFCLALFWLYVGTDVWNGFAFGAAKFVLCCHWNFRDFLCITPI